MVGTSVVRDTVLAKRRKGDQMQRKGLNFEIMANSLYILLPVNTCFGSASNIFELPVQSFTIYTHARHGLLLVPSIAFQYALLGAWR